ncbi:hypothetical protein BDW02DRAFT_568618 [Decorospora gaudefroyi]|uniref:Uncharacterized protein n=1 Tax=Decorospora gaudefroyi TaxID=184978 RepID=A0A6A5KC52_9PLEO|nr:hypothetical protein BDW02DRAFT_568618 [Decorospora gaudefroyi]
MPRGPRTCLCLPSSVCRLPHTYSNRSYISSLSIKRWDWSYDVEKEGFVLVVREPMLVMEEQEYLLLMKPKFDEVMEVGRRCHEYSMRNYQIDLMTGVYSRFVVGTGVR